MKMNKTWVESFIIILILTSLFSTQYTITFGIQDYDPVLSSSGIILCTENLPNYYMPVEVNSFRPGDVIVFNNELNISRRIGVGLTLNLTWHFLIFNPFNFTVYDASAHASYNNSIVATCKYWQYFDWNVTYNSIDGTYQAVLVISESISRQSINRKAFFKVYSGLSQTVRYHLNYTIMLENVGSSTAMIRRLYVVKLPNIERYQRVLEGPTFSYTPSGQLIDQFGNKYAIYDAFTLGAHETFNITVAYVVEENVSYVGNLEAPISKINRTDLSFFLASQQYIESNASEIVSLAKMLAGNESNVFDIGKAIFDYTSTNITYNEEWLKIYGGEWHEGQEGALWTLRNGSGLCRHFSALYVALARSLGIPSVVVMGCGFINLEVGKLCSGSSSGNAHAWILLYLPEYGWMPVEPQGGWWWGWQYGSSLPSHIIFVKGELSKFNTEEGEAWVSSYTIWCDQSVKSKDVLNYIVEPLTPKRQNITMDMNITSNIHAGSNLKIGCRLDTTIDGLAMVTLTSPAGTTYQEHTTFKGGETHLEWMVPAEWKNVGRWNVSVAFPGDELHEWCLDKKSFNVSSVPSEINVTVSPENPVENEPLKIQGYLTTQFSGENVTLTIAREGGAPQVFYAETSEGGYFSLDLSQGLTGLGRWVVNASWSGGARDLLYASASNSATFEVQAGLLTYIIGFAFLSVLIAVPTLLVWYIIKRWRRRHLLIKSLKATGSGTEQKNVYAF